MNGNRQCYAGESGEHIGMNGVMDCHVVPKVERQTSGEYMSHDMNMTQNANMENNMSNNVLNLDMPSGNSRKVGDILIITVIVKSYFKLFPENVAPFPVCWNLFLATCTCICP